MSTGRKTILCEGAAAADAGLAVVGGDGAVLAACSLWWSEVPAHPGRSLGAIGAFSSTGARAATELIRDACRRLADRGCTLAVAPMDGNTWAAHRFVTASSGRPPFFLEPWNPPEWPRHFEDDGWVPLSRYSSSTLTLPTCEPDEGPAERAASRLEAAGVTIRSLNPDAFDEELRSIHAVSRVSFAQNFLYTPIGYEAFSKLYRKVQPVVIPELVLMAEQAGAPAGFAFGIPDRLQAPGSRERAVIVKTLAVLPERRFAGLGSALVSRLQTTAARLGFTEAIHALQFENNASLRITARHRADKFREYTLYSKELV